MQKPLENPQTPEERAWQYLREFMKDDEKWDALRNGEFIQLTGSEGGKYILYPNGHVIDLMVKNPKIGRISNSDVIPFPDVLCTMYAWITKDEKTFRENWGCGSMRVDCVPTNVLEDVEDINPEHLALLNELAAARRIRRGNRIARMQQRTRWYEGKELLLLYCAFLIPTTIVFIFTMKIIMPIIEEQAAATEPFGGALNIAIALFPLFLITLVILMSRKMYDQWR